MSKKRSGLRYQNRAYFYDPVVPPPVGFFANTAQAALTVTNSNNAIIELQDRINNGAFGIFNTIIIAYTAVANAFLNPSVVNFNKAAISFTNLSVEPLFVFFFTQMSPI